MVIPSEIIKGIPRKILYILFFFSVLKAIQRVTQQKCKASENPPKDRKSNVKLLLLFLRIYQNLSTNFPSLFLLNITTQGVRHHSPSTTSLSLLFVRWTREGLLARRSVLYLIWTVVPGSLDPFSLAISPIVPDLQCSVPTFAWSCYLLILSNLALYKR